MAAFEIPTYEYDREHQALYIAGLVPFHDQEEAQACLDLASRLIPVLAASRASRSAASQHPKDYQRDDE